MNLIANQLKNYFIACLALCYTLCIQKTNAQEPFATLKKNINPQAKNLHHSLNKTKDTLILKSDKKINYVYSINRKYKREIHQFINAKDFEVALTDLSDGKHVMVVGQNKMKIVFVIWIKEKPSIQLIGDEILITSNNRKD